MPRGSSILSRSQRSRVQSLALARWRQDPYAPTAELARRIMRTVLGVRVSAEPERLGRPNQRKYFAVLQTVAAARQAFLRGQSNAEAVTDWRRGIKVLREMMEAG